MCFDECIYLYNHYHKSRFKIFPSFHEIVLYNLPIVPLCLAPKKHWPFHHYSFKYYVCLITQSWLTLCDLTDCSLSGSSVCEILQARILAWAAIPSPGDLPNLGIKPRSLALQVDSLPTELSGKPPSPTGISKLQQFRVSMRMTWNIFHNYKYN